MTTGVTAEPAVTLRSTPSRRATAIIRVPRASRVRVLRRSPLRASFLGEQTQWVFVATDVCADTACMMRKAGWVPETAIAYPHNFRPLRKWRTGRLEGGVGNYAFSYRIAANGTFSRWSIPCLVANCGANAEQDVCGPSARRVSRHCVGAGRLYRYRNLVWAEGYDYLYVDDAGRLCALHSGDENGTLACDRQLNNPLVAQRGDLRRIHVQQAA